MHDCKVSANASRSRILWRLKSSKPLLKQGIIYIYIYSFFPQRKTSDFLTPDFQSRDSQKPYRQQQRPWQTTTETVADNNRDRGSRQRPVSGGSFRSGEAREAEAGQARDEFIRRPATWRCCKSSLLGQHWTVAAGRHIVGIGMVKDGLAMLRPPHQVCQPNKQCGQRRGRSNRKKKNLLFVLQMKHVLRKMAKATEICTRGDSCVCRSNSPTLARRVGTETAANSEQLFLIQLGVKVDWSDLSPSDTTTNVMNTATSSTF